MWKDVFAICVNLPDSVVHRNRASLASSCVCIIRRLMPSAIDMKLLLWAVKAVTALRLTVRWWWLQMSQRLCLFLSSQVLELVWGPTTSSVCRRTTTRLFGRGSVWCRESPGRLITLSWDKLKLSLFSWATHLRQQRRLWSSAQVKREQMCCHLTAEDLGSSTNGTNDFEKHFIDFQ